MTSVSSPLRTAQARRLRNEQYWRTTSRVVVPTDNPKNLDEAIIMQEEREPTSKRQDNCCHYCRAEPDILLQQ